MTISSAAFNCVAVSNGDETIAYTSTSGFSGSDLIGYTVDDAFGQTSNKGTVSVSVSISIPPIANPGTGFKPRHTYAAGGVYTVTLTVTDNDGDHSIPSATTTIAFLEGDSDNDGLPDDVEDANGYGNVDPGETDPFNSDTDNDGLTDGYEVNVLGSGPNSTTHYSQVT